MKSYIDLNLSNPALASLAVGLGWGKTFTLNVVQLPTKLRRSNGTGCNLAVIESTSADLLAETCKKQSKEFDLINPLQAEKFDKSSALLEMAAAKGKGFEIPLFPFLHSSLTTRARLIGQTSAFLRKCIKRSIPIIITTRAQTGLDAKSPYEVLAFCRSLGLNQQEAQACLSLWPEKLLGETSGLKELE